MRRLIAALFDRRTPSGKKRRAGPRRVRRRAPPPIWLRPLLRWGIAGSGGAAVIAGSVWLVETGWVGQRMEGLRAGFYAATVAAGFEVDQVLVVGRREARRDRLLAALDVRRGDPLLAFDPQAARHRIEGLPWVRSAVVERSFPDVVRVRIVEREPLALWQGGGRLALIDTGGVVIALDELGRFRDLPILVGEDVPAEAPALLAMVRTQSDLARRVTAAVRVGGRRWNLRIDDRIDIELPEIDPAEAWGRFAALERAHAILDRDIVAIDLRIPDRLLVRLAPGATAGAKAPEKST